MIIHARLRCDNRDCRRTNPHKAEWSGEIHDYQLGLLAIWFHSGHEGHPFSYWENHELILGQGEVSED